MYKRQLLDHADRAVTGSIADPAVLAAVAAVERFSVVLGSVDPVVLRAALQQGDRVETSTRVSAIVAQSLTQVQIGLARRAHGQPVDAGLVNHDAGSHGIATEDVYKRQTLGYGVATDKIEADYSDGVLRLTIPVAEEAKPRKIAVSHAAAGAVVSSTVGSAGPDA